MTGDAGSKALSSLEVLWQRQMNLSPTLSPINTERDLGEDEPGARIPKTSGSPAYGRPPAAPKLIGDVKMGIKADGELGKVGAHQREVANLTMQQQKLQARCRELQSESRQLETDVNRRKGELRELSEQVRRDDVMRRDET